MLHPSYTELMEKINSEENRGEEPVINSRYSIVIASSKRARELIAGAKPMVDGMEGEKPLSVAVKELYDSKVKILQDEEEVDAHQDSVDVENGHADLRSVSDDVQEMLSARMKTRNLQQPS